MLSKALINKRASKTLSSIFKTSNRCFSHGPYNPMSYKTILTNPEFPDTEDYYQVLKSVHSNPAPPIYNMRHIHPIR